MKPFLSLLACAALCAIHVTGEAQATPAASDVKLAAAQRVAHANRSMILASAQAGRRLVAVGDRGVVLLSDDAGRSYRQAARVPVDLALTAVSFIDDRRGWAAGHGGVILRTQDGGENWALQRSELQPDRPLFGVHFFDAQRGVAVGLWSLVLVTQDGGASWKAVTPPIPAGSKKADLNLLGLFADSRGRVFATAEKGMVLRSDDQGQHWKYLATGYKGSLWTGVATASGVLVAAGLRGSLFRSADDGLSWQRIDSHSQSSITALASSGRDVRGVGLDGLTLRSEDDGATFKAEIRPDRLPLTSLVLDAQGQVSIYSRQGIAPQNP